MNRSEAREAVFCLIYESGFHLENEAGLGEQYILSVDVREIETNDYIFRTYHGVVGRLEELDSLINSNTVGWKLERMSRVTLAILRLCVYEMLASKDIPLGVAINEAVELAKKYDHDKAPAFVNGIANKIAEESGLKKES